MAERKRRPRRERRPLPLGLALFLYLLGTVLGLAGAAGLWMMVGIWASADHDNGVFVSVLTTALFLIPIGGLFWAGTWLVLRARVGHRFPL